MIVFLAIKLIADTTVTRAYVCWRCDDVAHAALARFGLNKFARCKLVDGSESVLDSWVFIVSPI
jgi:hypothetical protein